MCSYGDVKEVSICKAMIVLEGEMSDNGVCVFVDCIFVLNSWRKIIVSWPMLVTLITTRPCRLKSRYWTYQLWQ